MPYQGSCHCGAIAIEVDAEIDGAMSCNCSICRRRGSLHWFVGRDQLRLQTPETALSTYTFNKHVLQHRFCAVCGIHVYGEGADPQGKMTAAVNLRCIDGIDLEAIPVQHYDGSAL